MAVKKLISVFIMFVLLIGCIALAACGSKDNGEEKTTTAASTKTTAKTTEKTTTSSSSGGLTWNDMPVYSGAGQVQKGTWSVPPSDDEEYAKFEWRYYESSASVSEVAAFYRSQMPGKGWEEKGWMEAGEMSWGMYNKNNENDAAIVSISGQDGKTAIALWRAAK
jgi:hypothetical protein